MIILIDMDGTIVYAPERNHIAIKKAFEDLGFDVPIEIIRDRFKFTEDPIHRIKRIIPEISDKTALEIRYKMSNYFYELYKMSKLIPGAKQTLDELSQNHILILVTSRSNHNSTLKELEYLGIKQYFNKIITAGILYDPKTSFLSDFTKQRIQLLRYALDGQKNENVMVIGDRRKELEAGKILGYPTVGVLSGVGTFEELKDVATYIIESIKNLNNIIKF